jgi:hypothetical protein
VEVQIDPAALDVEVGGTATVDVAIEGAANLGSYSFTIEWDPAVLSFAGVSNGTMLGSTGRAVVCPPPSVGSDSVSFGCTSIGVTPGPDGEGVLATITFSAAAEGVSFVDISATSMADILGWPSAVTSDDGLITVKAPTPTPTPAKTTAVLLPAADAYVFSNNPTQNSGPNVFLAVDPLVGGTQRAFLSFDVSSIPGGSAVIDATLQLCLPTNPPSGTDGRQHDLVSVTAGWTETGVTWSSQPGVVAGATDSIIVPGLASCVTFTVTGDVQSWVDGGANFGWRIADSAEGSSTSANATYASRENNDALARPSLAVSYVSP